MEKAMTGAEALSLDLWLQRTVLGEEYTVVLDSMLAFIHDYPDILAEGRSWPEIRSLAERYRRVL